MLEKASLRETLMIDERVLAEYLLIIKKSVNGEVKDIKHYDFKEDIIQDVFLKLFKADFFNKYQLNEKEQSLIATSYIKKAVKSCYIDLLKKNKIIRFLTEKERQDSDRKYENIGTSEDIDEHESLESAAFSSGEEVLMAKEFYLIIRECFEGAITFVSHQLKSNFLRTAFWEQDEYGLPLKKLAEVLGYENSNPTQDFNRFVQKVSECTQTSGVKVVNPCEQIEFLKQIIEIDGVTA